MNDMIEIRGKDYVSTKLLCERFGFTRGSASVMVKSGTLPRPLKIGRQSYFDIREVERMFVGE